MTLILSAQTEPGPVPSGISPSESNAVFTESYDFISSFPLREEGSNDEAEVMLYVERFASVRGFQTEYQALDGREDMHSFSSNLLVRVPGESGKTLIIAAPVDSYDRESDRALNPALALAFLDQWNDRKPPVTLLFLFTSADMEERTFLGSQSFLSKASLHEETLLLYLLLDDKSVIPEVKGSTAHRTSPGWYMETIRKDLEDSGVPYALDASGFLVNRAGLSVASLPLDLYLNEEIPSAAFTSSDLPGHEINEDAEPWIRFLHSLCLSFSRSSQSDWESNYVYWAWNKKVYFYLSERNVLILSLGILSLALILMLIHQRKIHLNFKRFRKHVWTIPVIVYLIFIFYMISTLFLEELLILLQLKDLWKYHSMYFLMLKVLNALLFSSVFINLLRGLPFPRNPHFYSYMAFASGLVNILIISYLNISFTPVLMINQLFIFLFIVSRNKGVKRFAIALSMIPQLLLLSYLFNRDYPTVFRFFLLSRVRGNWFLSLFSLPVICMMLAQHNYHHHYERSRQEMKNAIVTFLEGLLVLTMVIFSFQLTSDGSTNLQEVNLTDNMDLDTGIRDVKIESAQEIGAAVLKRKDTSELPIPAGSRSFTIQGETDDDFLSITWETREFLDRRSIDLNLYTKDPVDEILLEISSEESLVLYDSLYPYEISPDQKNLKIFIGINPPSPLAVSLIFSGNSRPDLHITILKDGSAYSLIPVEDRFRINSRTVISKTLGFESLKLSGSFNESTEPDDIQ